MKRGQPPHGYTIIETMMFLIITGFLLVTAITIFNGRIGRTKFTQSVREFDIQIREVLNDVASGLYLSDEKFACFNNSFNGPRLLAVNKEQGTNTDCLFLGKVMQLGVQHAGICPDATGTECNDIAVYTVVGLRTTAAGSQVSSLAEAKPILITKVTPTDTNSNPNNIDFKKTFTLATGLHVTKVINLSDGSTVGAIGFVSTLASYNGSDLVSGSQKVQIIPVKNTAIGQDASAIASEVKYNYATSFNESLANPNGGLLICLQSGTSSQKAGIKIGSKNREIGTDVLIDSGEVASLC